VILSLSRDVRELCMKSEGEESEDRVRIVEGANGQLKWSSKLKVTRLISVLSWMT